MASMSTFSHSGLGTGMGPAPGSCLQQRDSPMGNSMGGYCMSRPPSYDLGIGYGSRPSPCSPAQPYQMNGHQYNTNGSSSTGKNYSNNKYYFTNVLNCVDKIVVLRKPPVLQMAFFCFVHNLWKCKKSSFCDIHMSKSLFRLTYIFPHPPLFV